MSRTLLRLVLFISCAHALVHIYELAYPSVEQLIAKDFSSQIHASFQDEKQATGLLGTCFRLPFGLLAMLVGWMSDRWGAKRMLVAYLWGCAGASLVIAAAPDLLALFSGMFALGVFASIYHPAGLALISHATSPSNRPRALGIHGIFGSLGIGAAPFLAGTVLDVGATWRQYYLLLTLPGLLLGCWFLLRLKTDQGEPAHHATSAGATDDENHARWASYFLVTVFGATTGFIYAAFLNFLPRYMDQAGFQLAGVPREAMRNYLSGGALFLGMVGQYTAGRLARPGKLEPLLAAIMLANAPLLAWMALATGHARFWAACGFALVHFMNQPVYNSMIASYVPKRRRSLAYGFSFVMSFGVGSLGPAFAGFAPSEQVAYGVLSALALVAASIAAALWLINRGKA